MMRVARLLAVGSSFLALSNFAATPIPAGGKITVTDADITAGTYSDGFSFEDATGVIEFNTSSAPTMDITGAGTVKKTSASGWTMTKVLNNFTGDYVLQGGGIVKVTTNTRKLFGAESSTGGSVYVQSGNTIWFYTTDQSGVWANWEILGERRLHIAGTGASGANGALQIGDNHYNNGNGFWKYLILDADASCYVGTDHYQCIGGGYVRSNDDTRKTLTVCGKGQLQFSQYVEIGTNVAITVVGTGTSTAVQFKNLRGATGIVRDDDSPFTLQGGRLAVYNREQSSDPMKRWVGGVNRPIVVKGESILDHGSQYQPSGRIDPANTVMGNMSGGIDLTAGSKLKSMVQQYYQTTISGPLTGTGTLDVPGDNDNRGRTYVSSTNAAFAGSVTANLYNGYCPWLILGHPLSAGSDYTKVASKDVVLGIDPRHWSVADVRALYAGADLGTTGFVALDPTWSENRLAKFAYPGDVSVGCGAEGTVVLTNVVTSAEAPLRVATSDGTLRIAGEGRPIYLGDKTEVTLTHEMASELSVLEFDQAELVGVASPIIGRRGFYVGDYMQGVLRFKDCTYRPQNIHCAFTDVATDALLVCGSSSLLGGALEITGNSVVTSKMVVAGGAYYGKGAVYQRSGDVTLLGHATDWAKTSRIGYQTAISGAGNTHGYYEISGGTLTALGLFGPYDASGSIFQHGGTVTFAKALGSASAPKFCMCAGNSSYYGEVYVDGGTFDIGGDATNVNNNADIAGGVGAVTLCQVSSVGAGTFVDFRNQNLKGGNKPFTSGIDHTRVFYNMKDGGTLRAAAFGAGSDTADYTVNFDGGTLRLGPYGGDFFDGASIRPLVLVHAGGATIDTDGRDVRTATPIRAATGKGVQSVALPVPLKNIGFAPLVVIEGDGRGASAVADFDSENRLIRGIKILSPGTGYTTATAKLRWGNGMKISVGNADTFECVLADNPGTGDFTKTGEGMLDLRGVNTWGGKTIVKQGSIKSYCDWAIPTNTAVVLAGGDLDFNGKTAEVTSVTYGAGGGQILNAANVKLPETSEMAISAEDIANGKKVEMTGNMDLSKFTLTVSGDGSGLSPDTRYTIATATGGTFSGTLGGVTLDPSLAKWRVKVYPTKITMSVPRGLIIMVY